ncbi:unnamed protein product [Polarella glacialis]|uniref:non-specific serine/threonine protein kinase n=1 Tax=Polarella glacialis TaxID=89957 RepID=A0A813FBY3_POLGL|nr:unnamed protein product [Polarella glacialis]
MGVKLQLPSAAQMPDGGRVSTKEALGPLSVKQAPCYEQRQPSNAQDAQDAEALLAARTTTALLESETTPAGKRHLVLPLPQFDPSRYEFRRVLMKDLRNGGCIELFEETGSGLLLAAKRLQKDWVLESPEAFRQANPLLLESPWQELEMCLRLGSPSSVDRVSRANLCHGAFREPNGDILLMSEYSPGGDLFDIVTRCREEPGAVEREQKIWPVIVSLLRAVQSLHELGVAHGDISLENALLGSDGEVRLIDFEAAVSENPSQTRGTRGKPSYQPPEMHTAPSFDACSGDLFACGVCAYVLAVGDYPWSGTRPGSCRGFDFFQRKGLESFLAHRRVRNLDGTKGKAVGEILSPELRQLLVLLLDPLDPVMRYEALKTLPCERS